MPFFSFQSELLTPEMAATSALRMVVGVNGVSMLVKNEQKVLALKSWQLDDKGLGYQAVESELRRIFGSEPLLASPFKSKICALSSPAFTLVPRRLYHPEHLEQFFKLLLQKGGERTYGSDQLEELDCYLVWAAEAGLHQLCTQYFSRQNIQHLGGSYMQHVRQLAPLDGPAVFANILGPKVQVLVFERQNLVFFNSFDFTKPADLLYFVLLTYKQFSLNPLEIPLRLSGTIVENSELYKMLFHYIRTLSFLSVSAALQLPPMTENLPEHYWFDVSSL